MIKFLLLIIFVSQIYYRIESDGTITFTDVPSRGFKPVKENVVRRWVPPSERRRIIGIIREVAQIYGIEPEFLQAVVEVESGYDIYAVSPRGAIGLMQLMPDIIKRYNVINPYNPYHNLEAGILHLKELLDEFGRKDLALAAYNAGRLKVYQCKGVPPIKETMDFVRRVLDRYYQIKKEGVYGEKDGRGEYKESEENDGGRGSGRSERGDRGYTR